MKWLSLALLITISCRRDAPAPANADPSAPARATGAVSVTPEAKDRGNASPATTPAQNITIESVEVGNPLVVKGRARTFENSVALRVRDAKGEVIARTFTTARGEMGKHSPYEATVWVTADPGGHLTIEALEYSAKDGAETNLVSHDMSWDEPAIDSTLYFPDPGCTGVNSYVRKMPKSVSMARLLVEALVAGPTADEQKRGAVAAFPQGSRVESVNLRDGVLTVNFNERLRNVGGSCRAQMIRAAVRETLGRLPTVRGVVITAGGSEQLALQP